MTLLFPLPRGTRRSPTYPGDGLLTTFDVPFWFADVRDLRITVTPAGAATPTVLYQNGVGYTATGVNSPLGGTVKLLSAPPSGSSVVITGRRVPERLLSVANGNVVSGAALDYELGLIQAGQQELRRDVDEGAPAAQAAAADSAADRAQTALDRAQTGADRVQTGLDRVQTGLDRAATAPGPGKVLAVAAHGGMTEVFCDEQLVVLAGATVNSTVVIPAGAIVIAVSNRVVAAIAGAASYSCGEAGSPTRFGAGLGVGLGATNLGLIGPNPYYAATPVLYTATGGAFTGGSVRMTIHYFKPRWATS